MKHPWYAFLVAAIITMLIGCASPDIAVINLKDGKKLHPPHADMRQVVVLIGRDGSTFTTMTRRGSTLVLRTFDSSCKQLHEVSVPMFSEGYCGATSYALSHDGRKLVYLRDKTSNLYLLDLPSREETLLWEDIANTWMEIPKLAWISDSKILLVLRDYPGSTRKTNEITIFDVISHTKRTLYTPVDPASYAYSLSPDVSMLAFQDANKPHDIYGVIKILDLQSGAIRAILGSGRELIGNPHWSPDGSELAFVEGRQLKVWTLKTNQIRILRKFGDRFVCYRLVFTNNVIGYVGGEAGSSKNPLVVLDARTGMEQRTIKEEFNGGLFRLGNTNNVVSEIGY